MEELHEIALAKCDTTIKAFVECSKDNGLLVVFNCRAHNAAMNDCLTSYKNADQFAKYKALREEELLGNAALKQ